ncbi:MAG: hypothetical protein CMJ83_01670 [Planctomycetes bacterium]|nr:hypothetical protein [Planctomycetota bacterium]
MLLATFIKEMQLLARDRGGLFSMFLLPIIFITMFGLAFGGMDDDDDDQQSPDHKKVRLAAWYEKGHDEPQEILKWIRASNMFEVVRIEDVEELKRRVAGKDFLAGLVFGADYDPKEHPAQLFMDLAVSDLEKMAVLGPLRGCFAQQRGTKMSPVAIDPTKLPAPPPYFIAESPPGIRRPLANVDSFQVAVPGNSVLFAFFLALGVALSFHEERKSGTWKRLLAAPGARTRMLVGKLLPFLIMGILQMAMLFAYGHFVFDMRVGGSIFALGIITVCIVFTATGFGLLIASFGGTEKQISNYATILVLAMGLVGGCMMPRMFMPESFKAVGNLVPHGWALDAYYDVLIRDGTTLADVATPCLAILGFGMVFTVLGSLLFRFER